MRIGFDIRPFLKEETGVGIYFKNLLFSLSRIDYSNEYYLFSSSLKDRFPTQKIPPLAKKKFRDFLFPVKMVNFFWHRLGWPPLDYFFRTKLDLSHSPTPLILPTKGEKIVTVYDLFFMEFPQLTNKEARKDFFQRTEESLHKADGIITISHFTKSQIIKKFKIDESRVRVVYLGINHKYWDDVSPNELAKTKSKYTLPSSFILFVGALERRKNLLNLIKALKVIHKNERRIHLLLVGRKGEEYKGIKDEIKRQSLRPWVKMLGYVSDDDLRSLYRLASVLVYPSLYEGFGLPLLEAMTSGLPVVSSKRSALPEIAQDAALYFNPEEAEEIADKTLLALKDKKLSQTLMERGKKRSLDFDWEKTARETLSFYHEVLER